MTWPAYDPLTAAWQWLGALAGTLTEPGSPFWWPTILVAVLAVIGMGLAAGRSLAEIRRQALPCDGRRALRHLGIDLACFTTNAALPFLAAPLLFLLSAAGAAVSFLMLLPVFGQPAPDARIDDAGRDGALRAAALHGERLRALLVAPAVPPLPAAVARAPAAPRAGGADAAHRLPLLAA
jgi:hypothetical protein